MHSVFDSHLFSMVVGFRVQQIYVLVYKKLANDLLILSEATVKYKFPNHDCRNKKLEETQDFNERAPC